MQEQTPGFPRHIPILFGFLSVLIFSLYLYHNPVRWDAIGHNFYYIFLIFRPYLLYGNVWKVVFISLFWAIGFGTGYAALRLLRADVETVPRLLVCVPLGWGIMAYAFFALALLQQLNPTAIAAVLAGFSAVSIPASLPLMKPFRLQSLTDSIPRGWRSRLALLLLAVPVGYAFVSSLMPPTQSDGLRYHLTVPKLYLEHGGFTMIPGIAFSNFPFLIEYLYAVPLAFGILAGPKLIHCSYFFLTLGLAYHLAKRLGGARCGWLAALLIATTPFAPIFASWSFIEFGLIFYILLAFAYAMDAVERVEQGETAAAWKGVVLLGIMLGFAVCCKYTSLAIAATLSAGLLLPVTLRFPDRLKQRALFAAAAFLIGMAVASPWFVKNYILLGNPLYPFARGVFGSPGWSDFNAEFFAFHAGMKGNMNVYQQMPVMGKMVDLATLPFRATFFSGSEEERHAPENFGAWPLGSLWLIASIFILFRRRWNFRWSAHTAFSIVLFFLWALTYRDNRFLLPCLVVLSPVLGQILHEISSRKLLLQVILGVMLLQGIVHTTGVMLLPGRFAPWWVVSGAVSEEEYLARDSDFTRNTYRAFRYLKMNTQPDETVLLHGIDQPFYCPNHFISADWFNTDPLIAWSWQAKGVEDLLQTIRQNGIRYLVYDYGNIQRYDTDNQPYYRFFCLPQDAGLAFLREWVAKEPLRISYTKENPDFARRGVWQPPLSAVMSIKPYYVEWRDQYIQRLNNAYNNAPSVAILRELLDNSERWAQLGITEAYRYDEDPNNPFEGVVLLKIGDNALPAE